MKAYIPKRSATLNRLNMNRFKGVDFANNPLMVENYRSPDAVNLISDLAGFPMCRTGYSTLLELPGQINGIFRLKTNDFVNGKALPIEKILVHHGEKLDVWDMANETTTELYDQMNDKRSTCIQMNKFLWIYDGQTALVYGDFGGVDFEVKTVSEIAAIPTTVISRDPTGGGTPLDPINMIQPKRTNSFLGQAGVTDYQLESIHIDDDEVTVRILNSNGDWLDYLEDVHFTVDRTNGVVSFVTAPGASPVTGRDNIEITYARTNQTYLDRVNGCDIATIYGVNGAADRVFIAGNAAVPNFDFYSELNDPTYFGDLWYTMVGQDSTAIMGYSRLGDGSLAIHKERNGQDPTVFIRTGTLINNDTAFPLKQGAEGVGVVSKYAFANLVNDPLILSNQGVYAVVPVANTVANERYAQQRSYFINPRLIKEPNLEEAVGIEFKGFYYLAVNSHVYVADSRQQSYISKAFADQFQYEWYFWNNVPARVWWEYNNELYFGTADGEVMKFLPEGEMDSYKDNGENILCYWKTPILELGSFTNYKTLKNAYAIPSPYLRSEIHIDYIVKSIPKTVQGQTISLFQYTVKDQDISLFSFEDIDFSDFTFDTDTSPHIIPTNYKAKKFMLIQLALWSDSGKPFGFYGLTLLYTINGKFKG